MHFWQQCPWLTFIASDDPHAARAKLPLSRSARSLSASLALDKTASLLSPVVKPSQCQLLRQKPHRMRVWCRRRGVCLGLRVVLIWGEGTFSSHDAVV